MDRIIKTYKEWMGRKAMINNKGIIRSFKEGDVWWAAVGENVGVEIDGKSYKYSRIGKLSKSDYGKITKAYLELFS